VNRPLQKPILVMAGGTGGHVFPALAVAENLRERGESVVWLGTRSGIEARVVPAAGFAIEWLSIQGLRGKGALSLLLAPLRLLRACWQALGVLRRNRPKAVLGMGGFVAGPGGLMAWLLAIPLFVHEQNSVIGLTNRILSRLATRSFFAFPEAAAAVPGGECIGNPVRASFTELGDPAARLEARAGQQMHLLVIGGSLGAAALNRIVPAAVACLDHEQRPLIRHQCGERHLEACERHYREARVHAEVVRFIEDMREAYLWADLVICRAGALTIAELTAVGVASILVPFPYAVDDHQYFNASYLEQQQAAQIVREADLEARELALKIKFFQQNRPALVAMAQRARACFQADATERLVDGILAGAAS
jgi:UDP-N-acetylglucosamine--N-acetylmuramyl-(pentapeptide) pyrophosphoryl-undecaprenol N-acetylglucosamine transferase